MAVGQSSLDGNYANLREDVIPGTPALHRKQKSGDGVEFGQGAEFGPKHDGGALQDNHKQQSGQDFPAVAVAPDGETEVPSIKATSADVSEQNAPWTRNRENRASERSGAEAAVRNVGAGPSPLHPHSYPGRLGKKLPADSRRNSESGGVVGLNTSGKARPDKSALLPKFGEWDVNDPASGEGYTIIFDKARDEKKTGGAVRIPPNRADSPITTNSGGDPDKLHGSSQESSCPGWLCCCFHQSGTK